MKKVKNVLNSFFEIVKKSKHKPKELWVDQGKQFFNSPMQKWLHDNGILLYSTHNEGKSVVAEIFVRTSTKNDS